MASPFRSSVCVFVLASGSPSFKEKRKKEKKRKEKELHRRRCWRLSINSLCVSVCVCVCLCVWDEGPRKSLPRHTEDTLNNATIFGTVEFRSPSSRDAIIGDDYGGGGGGGGGVGTPSKTARRGSPADAPIALRGVNDAEKKREKHEMMRFVFLFLFFFDFFVFFFSETSVTSAFERGINRPGAIA